MDNNLNEQLIEASEKGDLSQVKYSIDHGADAHYDDDYALREAAYGGHMEIIKYLVEEHKADAHAVDDQALRYAALEGYFEIVKYLVEEHNAAGLNSELKNCFKTYDVLKFTKRHIDKQNVYLVCSFLPFDLQQIVASYV